MEWFFFSIFATCMFGIQSFLYKRALTNSADKFWVTLFFMLTVEVFAIVYFSIKGFEFLFISLTLLLGFLFALCFFLKTIFQFKALEFLPTNIVFPISAASIILTVFYAIIFFKEKLSIFSIVGIILIILAITLIHYFAKSKSDYKITRSGFLFAIITIPFGAGMMITNKYAATSTNLGFFIMITYLFSIMISFGSAKTSKFNQRNKLPKMIQKTNWSASIKYGIIIGIINFMGYISLLTALKSGPLVLVSAIHPNFIIITAILAKLFNGEELSLKQFGLVCIAVLGIILLRI